MRSYEPRQNERSQRRRLRVLILGGSSEASALVRALATRPATDPWPAIDAILSLAGRTVTPLDLPIATRTGGFGGAPGLAAFLADARIHVLVDATHPFAARMSHTARLVAAQAGLPLIRLTRAAWQSGVGDRWQEVDDMAAAAAALGPDRARVFLTVGRLQLTAFALAPQHAYLVRTIDPVDADHGLPEATFIEARGPFAAQDEARLMRDHAIDIVVTKNSGGAASAGKLEAARQLGLPVILVRRPAAPDPAETDVAAALVALEGHARALAPRGV